MHILSRGLSDAGGASIPRPYGRGFNCAVKKEIEANKDIPDWYYSDEEKPKDIMDRAFSFIKDLEQRKENSILVVTHGEMMRTIVLLFMHREQANSDLWIHFKKFFWVSNTAITILKRLGETDPYTVNVHIRTSGVCKGTYRKMFLVH